MTIKTIISPEDEKEFYRLASLVGTDARDPRGKLMAWLERFDANRRSTLLDEIEKSLPSETTENERDYEDLDGTFGGNLDDAYNGGFSDGLAVGLNQQREAFLSTLNKYRV